MLVAQSCLTHCNPMDCGPPGSSVHEIFQARILAWVAISLSRGSSQTKDRTWVSYTADRFFTRFFAWATSKALPCSRRVVFLYQCIPVKVFFLKWRNLSKLIQISIFNEQSYFWLTLEVLLFLPWAQFYILQQFRKCNHSTVIFSVTRATTCNLIIGNQ